MNRRLSRTLALSGAMLFAMGAGCVACPHCGSQMATPELPPGVGHALNVGIPLQVLNESVLDLLDPSNPSTHIKLRMEFADGPQLTMLRVPGPITAAIDVLVAEIGMDSVPPLEVDTVLCGVDKNGDTLQQDANGFFPRQFVLNRAIDKVGADLSDLSFAAPPPGAPANTLDITMQLRNVSVTLSDPNPHDIVAAQADVFCRLMPLLPVNNSNGCGELPVVCSEAEVAITGMGGWTNGLDLGAWEDWIEDELRNQLLAGARVHFGNFNVSSAGLTFDMSPNGLLTAMLAGADDPARCSEQPPVKVPPAPFRAVSRARPKHGNGYFRGSKGSIIPFNLVPDVKADWIFLSHREQLAPWTSLSTPQLKLVGGERARLVADGSKLEFPKGLSASIDVIREVPNECPIKPEPQPYIIESVVNAARVDYELSLEAGYSFDYSPDPYGCDRCLPQSAFIVADGPEGEHGPPLVTRDPSLLPELKDLLVIGVDDVYDLEREIVPFLRDLDGDFCPGPMCFDTCGDTCESWVGIKVREHIPPFDIGDFKPPFKDIVPFEFTIFVKLIDPHLLHNIGPKCRLEICDDGCEEWNEEQYPPVVLAYPEVTFAKFQIDNASFESNPESFTLLDGTPHTTGWDASSSAQWPVFYDTVNDPQGANSLRVILLNALQCLHEPKKHGQNGICWSGDFGLPKPGVVRLSSAVSGTIPPRVPLNGLTSFGGMTPALALGTQTVAVHGTLDRSGISFSTSVPQVYRDAGITTEHWDHREIFMDDRWGTNAVFDWEHDSTFLRPSQDPDFPHPRLEEPRWHSSNHKLTYFTDWDDQVLALWTGDWPTSHCMDPSDRFASPRAFTFSGGKRGSIESAPIPATTIFTNGRRGPNGEYEVAKDVWASGSFAPAAFP